MANIEKSLVTKAVKALMYHHAQKLENKQDVKGKIKAKTPLMPELEAKSVSLIVTLNNLPQSAIRQKPYLIPLKFPLRKYGNTEICLFVKDPTKTVKKQLAEKDIKIKKVLGVDKIHKKFNTFELKRILCDSYEFFLADDRIVPIIPRLASNTFYKKKKQPHVISLEPYNTLENRIKKAVESAHLFIQKGHCCNIKVGSTDVAADQMVENICNVLEYLGDKAPLKWNDIQSIHVKTDDSIALPLYTNPNLVAEASPDATASITNKKRSRKEISESVDDSEEKEEKPKKPTAKKQKKEEPAQEAPAKNTKAAKKAVATEKKQDEEPKKQAKDETPAPSKKQKKTKGKKKDVEMFDDQEMNVDDEELKKSIESFSKAKKQKQQQLGAGKIKSGVVKAYPKKLKAKK